MKTKNPLSLSYTAQQWLKSHKRLLTLFYRDHLPIYLTINKRTTTLSIGSSTLLIPAKVYNPSLTLPKGCILIRLPITRRIATFTFTGRQANTLPKGFQDEFTQFLRESFLYLRTL